MLLGFLVCLTGLFEQLGFDFLIGLRSVNLNNSIDGISSIGVVPIGIADLEVDGLPQHDATQGLFEGTIGDGGDSVTDNSDLTDHGLVKFLVSGVLVDIGHRDLVIALDLETAVPLDRSSQPGRNAAQSNSHISTHRKTGECLHITTGHLTTELDGLSRIECREVGVIDPDEEPFPGLDLLDTFVLAGHVGSDFLQRGNGPAVMAQLKVAQPDVVIRLVDLRANREVLDHISHHAETLSEITSLVEADSNLQGRLGPLVIVPVFLSRDGLKMHPGLVVCTISIQVKQPQTHMRLKANAAAWVSFNHALPDLDRLFDLLGLQTRITGVDQLAGRTVLDQRTSQPSLLGGLGGLVLGLAGLNHGNQKQSQQRTRKQKTCHPTIPLSKRQSTDSLGTGRDFYGNRLSHGRPADSNPKVILDASDQLVECMQDMSCRLGKKKPPGRSHKNDLAIS